MKNKKIKKQAAAAAATVHNSFVYNALAKYDSPVSMCYIFLDILGTIPDAPFQKLARDFFEYYINPELLAYTRMNTSTYTLARI